MIVRRKSPKGGTASVPSLLAVLLLVASCQNIVVETETVDPPTIAPAAGAYGADQTVTIAHTDPDVAIYYTTDGSSPTEASTAYEAPFIAAFGSTTVRAMATKPGLRDSTTVTRTIRVVWGKVNEELPVPGFVGFDARVQAAAYGDSAIRLYGEYGSGSTLLYQAIDIDTGAWSTPSDNPDARSGAALLRHGEDLLLIGGYALADSAVRPTARRWDGSAWQDAGNIDSRYMLGAVSIGTSAYALGGIDDPTTQAVIALSEEYTNQTGTTAWGTRTAMPAPRAYFSAAHSPYGTGHIYVFGGYDESFDYLGSILDYDIESDQWTTLPESLPRAAVGSSAAPWAGPADKPYVLVFGNHVAEGNPDTEPQIGEPLFFDPAVGSVRLGTALEGDDARGSAAVNVDGRIFLACASGNVWEYLPGLDTE